MNCVTLSVDKQRTVQVYKRDDGNFQVGIKTTDPIAVACGCGPAVSVVENDNKITFLHLYPDTLEAIAVAYFMIGLPEGAIVTDVKLMYHFEAKNEDRH